MINLVRKDLEAAKLLLLLVLPLGAVQLGFFASTGPIYFPFAFLFAGLLAVGSIPLEVSHQAETLWNSLPVSRGEIVVARYATAVLGILSGLAAGWGAGWAATMLLSSLGSGRIPFPGLPAHALLFSLLVLGVAFYLPFVFHWGAGRGTMRCVATWVGILLLLTIGVQVLLFLRGTSGLVFEPGSWQETAPRLRESLAAWLRPRLAALLSMLTAFSLAALVFSCLLSRRLYEKRDL